VISLREDMLRVAEVVLKKCMGVKSHETVLILTDEPARSIGFHLWVKTRELAKEAIYIEYTPRKRHGEEPPKPVAEAMKYADVILAPTSKSITHTQARKEATERGARVGTMPGITEDIFLRAFNIDFDLLVRLTEAFGGILDEGKRVRVVTEKGTDIEFSIEGRKARRSTGILTEPGSWGNIPSGEAYIAPVEGSANGVIVVDGSIAGVGLVKTPVTLVVKDGVVVDIRGGEEAEKLRNMLADLGVEARMIGEFGIGTNPGARVSGVILEDEKAFGTVHFALGSNFDFGGTIRAPIHIDMVILRPSVYVDGKLIIRNGEPQIKL
jgi:leucyl aminopeptidase (aminopeptidase T)